MKRRNFCTLALAACGGAFLARPSLARSVGYFAENGVALGGADVVAYFTEGVMRTGQGAHRLDWRGVTWVFSSAENLAIFEQDPHCFAPQFGGYCAMGMSEAQLFSGDPSAFAVRDKRLYLANSPEILAVWLKDADTRILRARANWALMQAEG